VKEVKKKAHDLKAALESNGEIEEFMNWGNLKAVGYPTFEKTEKEKKKERKKERRRKRKKRKMMDDEAEEGDDDEEEGSNSEEETESDDEDDGDRRAGEKPDLSRAKDDLVVEARIKAAAEVGEPVCKRNDKREDKKLAEIARMEDRVFYEKKRIERKSRRKKEMEYTKKKKN
jgi:hypothetical protein